MTPDLAPDPKHEHEIEKPAEPESTELTTEGMDKVVGGITLSTQPRLTQPSLSASSLIAKVTIEPCF